MQAAAILISEGYRYTDRPTAGLGRIGGTRL